MTPPAPAEQSPKKRRLRAVTATERRKQAEWWITFRFVREVERLEREGRVQSRGHLESTLGLHRGQVSLMRIGRLDASTGTILLLKQLYNGDLLHILTGAPLDTELSAPYIFGRGRIDNAEWAYVFRYKIPAGWKVGPQPEAHPDHYPEDPDNLQWEPHKLSSKRAKRTSKDDGPAD